MCIHGHLCVQQWRKAKDLFLFGHGAGWIRHSRWNRTSWSWRGEMDTSAINHRRPMGLAPSRWWVPREDHHKRGPLLEVLTGAVAQTRSGGPSEIRGGEKKGLSARRAGGSKEAWSWGRRGVQRGGMVKEGHHGDRLPLVRPGGDICPEGFGGYNKGVQYQMNMKIHYFVYLRQLC